MSELHHHPERATHHRSLDMLMEVQFVLEHAERSLNRLRALGHEPSVDTLETRSELTQLAPPHLICGGGLGARPSKRR